MSLMRCEANAPHNRKPTIQTPEVKFFSDHRKKGRQHSVISRNVGSTILTDKLTSCHPRAEVCTDRCGCLSGKTRSLVASVTVVRPSLTKEVKKASFAGYCSRAALDCD